MTGREDSEMLKKPIPSNSTIYPFDLRIRPAFNGLFWAIVKAKRGGSKPIQLIVESEGLKKAVVEIAL